MADEKPQENPEEPKQEFFENDATDVEVEDVGERPSETKPWDPSRIRISTKPFSLRQVADMIKDGDIDLAPDFQRLYVWKPAQRSRLIESVLLGIPLPAFYFNQDFQGAMQVVDGVQRLTTINRFATGGEALSDLEYLKHLEGQTFNDLDVVLRRRFHQTQIFVNVIEPQTPDDVKFDVFRRINTGGSPLTAQEIRHCMSRKRSRDLLKALTALPSFHKATDEAFSHERRMADREVVLRFCAFRSLLNLNDYREFNSLDSFLLDFTRRVDGVHPSGQNLSEDAITQLSADFDRAMRTANAVFGNTAFRKYRLGATRRGPINRALFESWAVALADYEPEQLKPNQEAIIKAARKRMGDYDYNAAVSQGTGDISKVKLRFQVARDILKKAAG
ncbi:hypothetical protein CYFUS_004298 [Cystobacter fuscus]|uniref:GmrSD restriction endonucleases N-terminal domain-containing protein n=1 Tax=Cystobacter fuscus TaxID=43 RepID=A0A250J5H1_9BACT|nr:DUF262 domain-containing protein [Cystobacter fuscus]ATB38863.1 hypothetical protein CYFUS_004298 [Cystobacter fuscus]